MDILTIIVITLFTAISINIILKKIHIPSIIGYILTGTIIAYTFDLQSAASNDTLLKIAEFGVVFLMFTIGLEFSANKLKALKYEVFILGSSQILVTALVVIFISYKLFDLSLKTSVIIALIAALSSTAIVLKALNSSKDINKKYGRVSLSILIMQDIFVIPALLIVSFLADSTNDLTSALSNIVVGGLVLFLVLLLFAKYLLNPCFRQIIKTGDDELFVGTILFLAIGSSYLSHYLGFSYSLGAFIAGMLIAETRYKHQAEVDLIPFRDLLLGVFFITIGIQVDFAVISNNLFIISSILLTTLLIKLVIIYILVRIKFNNRVAIKTAFSLMQIGEFSLAILGLSKVNNLIDDGIAQIILAVIVLSMVITPIILKNIGKIADFFIRSPYLLIEDEPEHQLKKHIALIGFGALGQAIAKNLKERDIDYIAIESDFDIYHRFKDADENIIFGNAANKNILQCAKVLDAEYVIVAIANTEKLYGLCENLINSVENSRIIVKLHSESELDLIKDLQISNIIIENNLTAKQILTILQNGKII